MQGSLTEYYLTECPNFVELLDAVRDLYPVERYQGLSMFIASVIKIPTHELGLIKNYLLTGEHSSDLVLEKVAVMSGEDIDMSDGDMRAVFLSLMPDAKKHDVLNFVEGNWREIKQALDRNFPNRRLKIIEIRYLNKWLEIAEKAYFYKKEGNFNKEDFYADLASDYGITATEVKGHAKHYRTLMKLKHPHFKPDEESDDIAYSIYYEGDSKHRSD